MRTSLERPASPTLLVLFLLCAALTFPASADCWVTYKTVAPCSTAGPSHWKFCVDCKFSGSEGAESVDSYFAPVQDDTENQEVYYINDEAGCYYNFQHYAEGDRIVTNEPCLNCTCHNRMLMCYLRVCPFTKAIGQDCTVEKQPDQCCPVISCPEVPVKLLTSTTEQPTTTTALGAHDNYGCTIRNSFFADGVQVPSDPRKPCELCYCIRNRTACVMQECTLHVEGCRPVYEEGVCCPVRYDCDYEDKESNFGLNPFNGTSVLTTAGPSLDCKYGDDVFADGESIATDKPCEHCYCMRGDIVCAVQDCGEPLRGKDCTPLPIPPGQCCPASYTCANETVSYHDPEQSNDIITQVQGIINSIKDDTTPDMTDTQAEIISSEEVIPPGIIPSDESEIESHETNSVPGSNPEIMEASPGALHDNIEGGGMKDSEKFSTESVWSSTEVSLDDHASQVFSTSNPINEVDAPLSASGSNNVEPHEDDSKLSSTSLYHDISSSPRPDFETVQTTGPVVSGDTLHQEQTSDVPETPEVESSSHSVSVDSGILSETNVDTAPLPGPSADNGSTSEMNVDSSPNGEPQATSAPTAVNSFSDAPSSPQAHLESEVTESAIKDTTPDKDAENDLTPEVGASDFISNSSQKPDNTAQDFSGNLEAETYAPHIGETETASNQLEASTVHPVFNDKIDASSSSVKPAGSESTHGPSNIHHDEVPEDFPGQDEDDAPYVKPNEVVDHDEIAPEVNIPEEESNRIPGEGNCLIDGKTYTNTSIIPTSNPCHVKCECISSIPSCTLVNCPPPPPQHKKCEPIQPGRDTCCPTYACAEPDTATLEAQNQVISAAESSSLNPSESTGVLMSSSSDSDKQQGENNQSILSPSPSPATDQTEHSDDKETPSPVETHANEKITQQPPLFNLESQDAEAVTAKEPEYIPTTLVEDIEATKQPSTYAVTPVSLETAPITASDDVLLVAPNATIADETSSIAHVSADAHEQVASHGVVQPAPTESHEPPSSSHPEQEIMVVPDATAAISEDITAAPEVAPSENVATPTKADTQGGTHLHSEPSLNENGSGVVSSDSPAVVHDDSNGTLDELTDVNKGQGPVKTESADRPNLNPQATNEQSITSSDSGSGVVSESSSSPEKETAGVENVPDRDSQGVLSSVTTVTAEVEPEVVTELESGDVLIPESVGPTQQVIADTHYQEPIDKVTILPTEHVDIMTSGQTDTTMPPSDSEAVQVSPTQDEISSYPQSSQDASSGAVPSGDSTEYSPEVVDTTTQPHESSQLNVETGTGLPLVPPIQGELQSDIVSASQATTSKAEVSTEASPVVETIYHDENIHSQKPESDSSIYIQSNLPQNENGIHDTDLVSPSHSPEDNDLSSPSIGAASPVGTQSPETHSELPDISHDYSSSEANTFSSDSSSHPDNVNAAINEPSLNLEVNSPTNDLLSVQDSTNTHNQPLKPAVESESDHQSTPSAPFQTNEQLGVVNVNADNVNTGSQAAEVPINTSTETHYYDNGLEAEPTVAPLGVPGETMAGENAKPVMMGGTEPHHEDSLAQNVGDYHEQTALPEVGSSAKPEIVSQESQDWDVIPPHQTEQPVYMQETTIIPTAEDVPSGVSSESSGTNDGIPPNPVSSFNDKESETPEQTTLDAMINPDKISAESMTPQTPLVDSLETHGIVHTSTSSESSEPPVLAPQVSNNDVQTDLSGPVNPVHDELTPSTDQPSISTDVPSASVNKVVEPSMPESDSLTHETPVNSESHGSSSLSASQSTDSNPNQGNPSSPQITDGLQQSGTSELTSDSISSSPVGNPPEALPGNEAQNPEVEHLAEEIKDSYIPPGVVPSLTTDDVNAVPSVNAETNQEPLNVISSQINANTPADTSSTGQGASQLDERPHNVEQSPVEPSFSPSSPSSQPVSFEPSDPNAVTNTDIYQESLGPSSENPATPTLVPSHQTSHNDKGDVSSIYPNVIPTVQTGINSELDFSPASPQGQSGETPKPSPSVFGGIISDTVTEKPSHVPSDTDLLTSIIQGHLGDQSKPLTGYGTEIDSQLSELINRVSTPSSISAAYNVTAHDAISQSSWTPKPMPPQPEESSHRPGEEESFPTDTEYEEDEDGSFGPGTCKYLGKLYVSAQQIPRDDPCDFCFCFRSDIICLQQSCPPPIFGCRQESIQGFCCPRYECPVSKALLLNSTEISSTTLPPLFHGLNPSGENVERSGCAFQNRAYRVGDVISKDKCKQCICGADGQMRCDPIICTPEPVIRKLMEEAKRQRR